MQQQSQRSPITTDSQKSPKPIFRVLKTVLNARDRFKLSRYKHKHKDTTNTPMEPENLENPNLETQSNIELYECTRNDMPRDDDDEQEYDMVTHQSYAPVSSSSGFLFPKRLWKIARRTTGDGDDKDDVLGSPVQQQQPIVNISGPLDLGGHYSIPPSPADTYGIRPTSVICPSNNVVENSLERNAVLQNQEPTYTIRKMDGPEYSYRRKAITGCSSNILFAIEEEANPNNIIDGPEEPESPKPMTVYRDTINQTNVSSFSLPSSPSSAKSMPMFFPSNSSSSSSNNPGNRIEQQMFGNRYTPRHHQRFDQPPIRTSSLQHFAAVASQQLRRPSLHLYSGHDHRYQGTEEDEYMMVLRNLVRNKTGLCSQHPKAPYNIQIKDKTFKKCETCTYFYLVFYPLIKCKRQPQQLQTYYDSTSNNRSSSNSSTSSGSTSTTSSHNDGFGLEEKHLYEGPLHCPLKCCKSCFANRFSIICNFLETDGPRKRKSDPSPVDYYKFINICILCGYGLVMTSELVNIEMAVSRNGYKTMIHKKEWEKLVVCDEEVFCDTNRVPPPPGFI
ncbi:hypothetical protein H4219_005670 [Mycoemilia scoparia]|uniref:Uncharacterized protein n=1 Tax=Mycoemilia scoparia TaxID=417184 RepID=A0A9W7ZNG2_9FUNG|nr:hypothetical protein H4219_005670 [Mycoemilia scoparia]